MTLFIFLDIRAAGATALMGSRAWSRARRSISYFSTTRGLGLPRTAVRQSWINWPSRRGVISPSTSSPSSSLLSVGWCMAWPVFPRAKQGKVIIGPGFTHGVFHFRGELVFLDAHARIFKERLRADIGDLGRFDDVVYFLPGLFSGYFFDDVVGGPDLGFLADGKAGCPRHFRPTCHTHRPGHSQG